MNNRTRNRVFVAVAATIIATGSASAEEPFRIGAPAALSGKFVAFGAQVKKGVETAVEVWKHMRDGKVAGRDIEITVRDTQSNPSVTVSVMNKLMQSDKSDVLIGPGGSNIGAAAVTPWRQNPKHPIWIVPGVSTTVVEKQVAKDPYFFHTFPWTYNYHSTNVAAMKSSIGSGKKVAIIYSDGAYGRAHIEAARKYLKQGGYNIVGEELIRENASDFTPSILKVRAMHPDIIYTLVQTTDAVLLAKQIYSAKLNIPYLIGTAQAILPEWKNAVGNVQACWTGVASWMPGLTYAADPKEPKLFPSSADWEKMWRAKYKKEPEYMEVGAYVSTMLALLAVEKSNSTDRDKIRAELEAQDYHTPLGDSKFKPSEIALHQAFSDMVVFQQQRQPDGKFKSVIFYPKDVAQGKLEPCKR